MVSFKKLYYILMFNFDNLNQFYLFGNFYLQINFLMYLGISLFFVGLFGIIYNLERIIVFLMCVEIMWLGVSLCFLGFYLYFGEVAGLIFSICVLAIAASETAIGLALLVNFYHINKSISLRYLTNLRG